MPRNAAMTESEFIFLTEKIGEVAQQKFDLLPSYIDKLYTEKSCPGGWLDSYTVTGFPDVPAFNGALTTIGKSPGFHVRIEPSQYAVEAIWQRTLIDDDQHDVIVDGGSELMEAAQRTREKLSASPFVNGESNSFDFVTVNEEGVGIFSNSHTTKTGVSTTTGFDNLGADALTKTSLAETIIAMGLFKDDNGERYSPPSDYMVVVPMTLQFTLEEILKTDVGYNIAEGPGLKNVMYNRYTPFVWERLDDYSTSDWYVVSKSWVKKYMVHLNKVAPEIKTTIDWGTYQTRTAVYFRTGFGSKGWRFGFKHVT